MAIAINGAGTITGISAGGLPDGIIQEADLASGVGAGKLLQVVEHQYSTEGSTTSQIPADDTIPQSSEGVEITTKAFTPLSATSNFHITAVLPVSSNNSIDLGMALFMDSDTDAFASAIGGIYGVTYTLSMFPIYGKVASTGTSSRTVKLRFGPLAAGVTVHWNDDDGSARFGGTLYTTIRIMEIGA